MSCLETGIKTETMKNASHIACLNSQPCIIPQELALLYSLNFLAAELSLAYKMNA